MRKNVRNKSRSALSKMLLSDRNFKEKKFRKKDLSRRQWPAGPFRNIIVILLLVVCGIITNINNNAKQNGTTISLESGVDVDTQASAHHFIQDSPSMDLLESKPFFILHVGPPKTGSTTLQCTLELLRNELQSDNVAYIGRPECIGIQISQEHKKRFRIFEMALVTGYQCQREWNKNLEEIPSCWKEFLDVLEEYRKSNTTVIYSDEAMSCRVAQVYKYRPDLPYPFHALKVLERVGWKVQILMVNRPLYDYIPSTYQEQYKDGPNKVRLRQWFGGEKCVSHGGRVVPRPFDTATREITIARLLEKNQKLQPTPLEIYKLFQEPRFQILWVDMMESYEISRYGNLNFVQYIICELFPNTRNTCEALMIKFNTQNVRNPSQPLHYDFIAVDACQKGLLNGTKISRDNARRKIQIHQEVDLEKTANQFPLICPPNHRLQEIFNMTLDQEYQLRNMVTNDAVFKLDPKVHHRLVEGFEKAVKDKKFCTVNTTQVLEDKAWVEFFSTIEND